jgi:hypothetical protein
MSVFDGDAFLAHCHHLTNLCPELPNASDVDYKEGITAPSVEELQRIRDSLLAVGAPTPPPGFPMRIPRAAAGAPGIDSRPCDSPELWKVEFLQAVRDAVASHQILQERSCTLARDRLKAMQEAHRLANEGKNGWLGYTVFEQEMNKEIGRLLGKALAAQDRLFRFKSQIEEFSEWMAKAEVRPGGGKTSVPQEGPGAKALHEEAPAVTREDEPPPFPRWDEDGRTLFLGDRVLKKYNHSPAPNQIDVIEAFQRAGWPVAVDDPFCNPKKLNQTIADLNKHIPAGTIRFRQDGTGERVVWEYAM